MWIVYEVHSVCAIGGSRVATKAKGGFLLPLLLVGGAVAYFGVDEVEDAVRGALIGDQLSSGWATRR